MNKEITKQFDNWDYIQNLSLDILKSVSDEQLGLTVGKNMGTLGEQFRHIIRVRFQYAEAIENKIVADIIENIEPESAKSKLKLIELWKKANDKLLDILNKSSKIGSEDFLIDWKHWGIESMNIFDHLNALMDHEMLHNGEIIVYLKTYEIPFPKSWEPWGL